MKLGCIADDYTGATDLAGLLARSGARVQLHFGLPPDDQSSTADIEIEARKSGMQTLRQDGIRKALMGITTLEEILTATQEHAMG